MSALLPLLLPPLITRAGEDLMQMLQREMERRQQAERDAADARRDAHSTEALRTMQALQISQLNDTVAKMHAERQQYQSSSGDLVRGGGPAVAVSQSLRVLLARFVAHVAANCTLVPDKQAALGTQ